MQMKYSLKKLNCCCKKNAEHKDQTRLKVEEILNKKVLKLSKDQNSSKLTNDVLKEISDN